MGHAEEETDGGGTETHDQSEAFAISDRIVVMNAGHVEQIGTQTDIYLQPQTRFVAEFMGNTDFIPGRVGPSGAAETALGLIPLQTSFAPGAAVDVALRPDDVGFTPLDNAAAAAPANATIVSRQFLGIAYIYRLALDGGHLVHSWQPHQTDLAPGTPVQAHLRPGNEAPAFGKQ